MYPAHSHTGATASVTRHDPPMEMRCLCRHARPRKASRVPMCGSSPQGPAAAPSISLLWCASGCCAMQHRTDAIGPTRARALQYALIAMPRSSLLSATILICTYNRAALLQETLESLRRLRTHRMWDILVVDNNSSDDTR